MLFCAKCLIKKDLAAIDFESYTCILNPIIKV